jgi:hypothetical protein
VYNSPGMNVWASVFDANGLPYFIKQFHVQQGAALIQIPMAHWGNQRGIYYLRVEDDKGKVLLQRSFVVANERVQ